MESRKLHRKNRNKKIGKLRKTYDSDLLDSIHAAQQKWHRQKVLLRKSFSHNLYLEYEAKKEEVKYLYLFKEAKYRKLNEYQSAKFY